MEKTDKIDMSGLVILMELGTHIKSGEYAIFKSIKFTEAIKERVRRFVKTGRSDPFLYSNMARYCKVVKKSDLAKYNVIGEI